MIATLIAFTLLMNAERPVPLTPDIVLTIRAYERAEDLCAKGQWSHQGWEDSFKGLKWRSIGENLAKDFTTPEAAHKALMESPSHRANITSLAYEKVGVATGSCNITVFLFSD
jgi:uncharacterized protein YkwD